MAVAAVWEGCSGGAGRAVARCGQGCSGGAGKAVAVVRVGL